MTNYQCSTCKRNFRQKCHLDDHLNKKNKCIPDSTQISQNTTILPHKFVKTPSNIPNVMTPTINKINCNYCDKSFARKDAAIRHMNQYCPIAKQQNKEKQDIFDKLKLEREQQEIIEKLKLLEEQNKTIITINKQLEDGNKNLGNEIKNLKKEMKKVHPITNNNTMNNTVNNTMNNNTTNIIMVSYGHEDMSKITPKMLSNACKKGYNSIVHLVEMVHFNPIFPEFQNVYIPSVKDKHAMVYHDDMWNLKNKDDIVNEIYDTNRDYIMENIEGINNFLNDGEKRALNRWMDSEKNKGKSEKDKKAIDCTYENLKLLLHNKRHIPIGTRKQKAAITN